MVYVACVQFRAHWSLSLCRCIILSRNAQIPVHRRLEELILQFVPLRNKQPADTAAIDDLRSHTPDVQSHMDISLLSLSPHSGVLQRELGHSQAAAQKSKYVSSAIFYHIGLLLSKSFFKQTTMSLHGVCHCSHSYLTYHLKA